MIFALQKSASDHHAEDPEAATIVVYKFYMDDYPDSFQNSDEALKLSRDLVSLLELGGFQLTKLVSNVSGVTTAPDPDNREANSSVKIFYHAIRSVGVSSRGELNFTVRRLPSDMLGSK